MAGSRWFRRDALELDDDDRAGALDPAQGDLASRAVVGDDNVAQTQVQSGYGPHAESHDSAFLPSLDDDCCEVRNAVAATAGATPPTCLSQSDQTRRGSGVTRAESASSCRAARRQFGC
jgi:hypothetical protein